MPSFAGGGAETAMVRLTQHWAKQGRQITFVVNSAEGTLRRALTDEVRVVDLGALRTRRAFPRLLSWLRRERPRLLVSVLYHNIIAGALAKRIGSPGTAHVALVRNHTTTELARLRGGRRELEATALRVALRSCEMVGCVSDSVRADIVRFAGLGPDRLRVTYNPVPLPPHVGPPPRNLPPADGRMVITVGRLESQKDYPTLLKAIAIARKDMPVSLVILGEGSQRRKLESLCASLGIAAHVHFLGYVSAPGNYVAHADLFVLASRYEGFPNVITEALALGKTVVATDAPGGGGEILGHGTFGYLAPVGDSAEVARLIAKALRDPFDPARLKARASEFATAAVAARYDELFLAGLERKRLAQ
ncbi:MAG: glycosyltransferase [Propylenella sp.]